MLQLNDIAEVTKSIASDFDIERIYLFGSYARNEATEAISIYVLKQAAHFHFLTLELSYQPLKIV